MGMLEHMFREPLWLQAWMAWMAGVNTASVLYLRRVEARWVLGAFIGNAVLMNLIFELYGYNRLLGLAHVIGWTPLLVYLARRWPELPREGGFWIWIRALFATNALSLAVDYVDVARYALGNRG